MDWTQFWPSMIATFFGFILALIGQWFLGRRKERAEAKALVDRIKQEFNRIISVLSDIKITQAQIDPLKTPVWDAAINAGQISLLDAELREDLFSIYNAIREFNSWNAVQANYYFDNSKPNPQLMNEIEKLRAELLDEEATATNTSIKIMIANLTCGKEKK
jgi:hypothetical protein